MRSAPASYFLTDLTGGGFLTDERRPPPAVALTDLAERLRRLAPSARNPEHFHEEKSEIVHALRCLAREVAR